MRTISRLLLPLFFMLFSTVTVADDGSNRALSGVRPTGPPPHIQKSDVGRKKADKQVEGNKIEVKKDKKKGAFIEK